jgi:hypothetical protein
MAFQLLAEIFRQNKVNTSLEIVEKLRVKMAPDP